MIVSVLGGSSQSTPVLLNWLAEQANTEDYLIRLAGRHRQRLAAVERACKIVAPGIRVKGFEFAAWPECVSGSDLVLIQVRIGGYRGRHKDEQLGLKYGIPGDEGLGTGGLAAAVRTWPKLKLLLRLVRQHAPNALPLLLSSPGSLLVRLASLEWPDWPVYGICELPYTTLKNVCAATGLSAEEVTFSYTGVNHIGFLHSIKYHGADVVEQYAKCRDIPFSDIVRNWNAVPLKYLRLHFERAAVVVEQRTLSERSRAYALASMQRDAISTFQSGDAEAIQKTLAIRKAEWYTEAVGPFIAAIAGGTATRPFFLSSAEARGGIQERAFTVTRGIVTSLPGVEAPGPVSKLTNRFIVYERAAALAIESLRREEMIEALRLHPWLQRIRDAEQIAEEILCGAGRAQQEALLV